MKVLIVVFEVLLGGHVLSALTIARELKSRGYDVVIAGKRGRLSAEIEKEMPCFHVDIPLTHGLRESYFTWSSFKAVSQLKKIINEHEIDLVHAFDARSYFHCYIAALLESTPITCTLCGGIDPFYNLPYTSKLMVFSEEQKKRMVNVYGWDSQCVEIIRTRLDISGILDGKLDLSEATLTDYGIDLQLPKIMMISSFDSSKIDSVYQAIDACQKLYLEGYQHQLVLIGGKGTLFNDARKKASTINDEIGKPLIVCTGQVVNAFRLLKYATVVMGVGRSAFEGMAYGKPTIIVGVNGYAGLMDESSVSALEYYNFSGRNSATLCDPAVLSSKLRQLLDDPKLRADVGKFAKEFVIQEINVRSGIERIEILHKNLVDSSQRSYKLRDLFSFIKCLFPVVIDNSYHTLKRLFYALCGKKFPTSADIDLS